jgi:hypothetical protein
MKEISMKPRNLKFTKKQQLVCHYLSDLFTGYNVEIESFSFDDTENQNCHRYTLGIFIKPSPANDRKLLERALFEDGISYYYNDFAQQPFYQLDYVEVCANAHTDLMFNLNELKEYLEKYPTFRERGVNIETLEYKTIIEVPETEKNDLNADYIHGIYFHQYNSLFWFKIKDNILTTVEKEA